MLIETIKRYKKLLYLVVAGLILILGIMVYQSLQFRIVGTTPDFRNYPETLGVIDITFNRNLDKADLEKRINTNVAGVAEVNFKSTVVAKLKDDKTLRLYFSSTPLAGKYSLELKNITAADGSTLTKKLNMTIKDIPYDKLSEADKKLYDENSTDTADDHSDEYPIFAKLPHETDNYLISYQYDHNDPAPTLIITMKFFPPGNNAVPASDAEQAAYLNQLRRYRTEAIDWIKAQGASIDDYIMEYTEDDLRNEFPAGHSKAFSNTGNGDAEDQEDNL